jgi:hypothetical protein
MFDTFFYLDYIFVKQPLNLTKLKQGKPMMDKVVILNEIIETYYKIFHFQYKYIYPNTLTNNYLE